MISENRDILVERLEQKLVEKEKEINQMRDSLKDSIVSELREGMKDDLDFDKRINILEKKVKDMSLAYEGVMKELLDQKIVIQDLKEKYLKPDETAHDVKPEKDRTLAQWHDQVAIHDGEPDPVNNIEPEPVSDYIIAESEEPEVPAPKTIGNNDIIIADQATSKSRNKSEIVVEAREDEDVVIEYKK